ncbi:MAG TPA: TetR/AcrR family transcriptional regulator [Caldimonas sp.]|jgi:AcrR family transcriptional regulator|nr:TetR/AcrR family transcriptional regulator [Caldimonas sp.]HEX4233344.1 TetR/AcrR family transcriptional regulator [Caldimonas sp.]
MGSALPAAVAGRPRAAAATKRGSSRLPRLLDEAAHAFAQRGFAATSVREIVGPVGMLPGSLYCHFATKEALLAAVYREGVGRIGAAVDAAIASIEDPWQRLEAACVAHLSSLLDQTDYSQVVIRVRPSDAPAAEAELIALRDSYEKRFARLVAALPLARPTDRTMLRLMLVGALNWSQTWYRAGGGASPERIARRFVGVVKSSLAASARKGHA